MPEFDDSLKTIKSGLLSLKPAGADGFEGLLRIALTNLTGIPFRLASSGLQGGKDGEAAFSSDPVSFEAKLYSGKIDRKDVLVKIADLARKENAADRLWLLGATTEISTQLAEQVEVDGDKQAISTFLLDWTFAPLPLLAVAVIAAGDAAMDFLIANRDAKTDQRELRRDELSAAFDSINGHPEFENLLQRIKANLVVSKLAFKNAVDLNIEWREQTFSSTRHARERLGQGLAVLQDGAFPQMRTKLRKDISDVLSAGNDVVLLGDEGHGKSWLSAQLCADTDGFSLFISAEQLESISIDGLDDFLIDQLIRQTGERPEKALQDRWGQRFEAWKAEPPLASLFVVVDGLNQRQRLRWDKLINGIQYRLAKIGGRLIVTVRPHFWRKSVERGLAFNPKAFDIPEWLPGECDELLKHHGIDLDWLDKQTLATLRNPRLLAVAVDILPHQEAAAWKGLTTDRLLMEHLRASQLEKYEDETFTTLTKRLSNHATKVLERVQASANEPPQNFQSESTAVIETRFFLPLAGPGDQYELRNEGLTLALGFTLVDQLWQTHTEKKNLADRVTQLIEPINAMDRTVDVLFASLLICALDNDRFDDSIFAVLLDAFANLQNVNDQRFEEFVEIVKHQPAALFDTLKVLCLERGQRINNDWFVHAAFEVAATDEGWSAAETAIHHWLHCYNKDPVEQSNRFHRQSDDDYQKRVKKKTEDIDEELASLSAFESHLLDQMTEVAHEPDELFSLALKLLAGRSLVPFADSFIAMGLAFSLDTGIYRARKEFPQLTTFNRVDRTAARDAFLKAIEPLRNSDTSRGGQWTVVRMLFAGGIETDAAEASVMAKELRKDWPHYEPPSPDEWRQAKVADPNAARPIDIDEGLQKFTALDIDKMRVTMGVSREDHDFKDFLPVAARFEPDAAVEETRNILAGLLTRTEIPLRQIILNSEDHLPLVHADLALDLVVRMRESSAFETLPEQDQTICRMFSFYYAAGQLSSEEQLRCLTGEYVGSNCLLSTIPSFKPQPTEKIVEAIRDALNRNDEDAAHGALAAAIYGSTRVDGELEELILTCSRGATSMLRAAAFQLALLNEIDTVRDAHLQSDWAAASVDEMTYESWFGSMLLVEACARSEMLVDALLTRISQKTWFAAAHRLGKPFAQPLVTCFLQTLRCGVAATAGIRLPSADLELSSSEHAPFSFYSVEETDRNSERFPRQRSLKEVLGNDDDFDEKKNRLHAVAKAFHAELNGTDARLLVEQISIADLRHLVDQVPTLLGELVEILDHSEKSQFVWLKNPAFAVANLVSEQYPDQAVTLLNRASSSEGFLRLALGDDLTLEHQAIWGAKASEPIEKLWRERLLGAENDEVLAREVLAAERFGATAFINSLVQKLASSNDSLDLAYAITIAGYSIQSEEFSDLIGEHLGKKGASGEAAKHARSECKNAKWVHHWVESMWDAETPEEFWRCLMIAKTSMDARVSPKTPENNRWALYAPVFRRARKSSIKERNKERAKRLVGQETPEPIFVSSTIELSS